jgi:hypothetical protein
LVLVVVVQQHQVEVVPIAYLTQLLLLVVAVVVELTALTLPEEMGSWEALVVVTVHTGSVQVEQELQTKDSQVEQLVVLVVQIMAVVVVVLVQLELTVRP